MNKMIFTLILTLTAFPIAAHAQENMTFGHPNPEQKTYKVIKTPNSTIVVRQPRNCRPPMELLNKSIDDINGMKFSHPVRIIRPNDAVTMDHNPDRLNIILDHAEIIRQLRCG